MKKLYLLLALTCAVPTANIFAETNNTTASQEKNKIKIKKYELRKEETILLVAGLVLIFSILLLPAAATQATLKEIKKKEKKSTKEKIAYFCSGAALASVITYFTVTKINQA